MSIQAISWAIEDAPDVPPHLVSTLIGLANHADRNGRGAYPSQETLSHYNRKTERQTKRDLDDLQSLGLIRQGDQRFVLHVRPDRRPIVWDLALERVKARGDTDVTSPNGVTPRVERGDIQGRHGVTPTSPEPTPEPTPEPVISSNEEIISPRARTRTPAHTRAHTRGTSEQIALDGMPAPVEAVVPINRKAEETFARFWAVYPRKTAKKDAWKAWPKAIKAADPDVIMAGLDRYVVELHRTGSYVAHATTWLNGQRWEDEPATVGNAARGGTDRRGSGGYARHFEHLADDAYDAPMNY
jgi:hypothetical protein